MIGERKQNTGMIILYFLFLSFDATKQLLKNMTLFAKLELTKQVINNEEMNAHDYNHILFVLKLIFQRIIIPIKTLTCWLVWKTSDWLAI